VQQQRVGGRQDSKARMGNILVTQKWSNTTSHSGTQGTHQLTQQGSSRMSQVAAGDYNSLHPHHWSMVTTPRLLCWDLSQKIRCKQVSQGMM
jgi:hypothetical protein